MAKGVVDKGSLTFTVDTRILRELGERLVRRPETALIELIKNAYDADATECTVRLDEDELVIEDNGQGMTLSEFTSGWMRIGTASKAQRTTTPLFGRQITGEKGIGRFSVRFLGESLRLTTTAEDLKRGFRTTLTARFNWPEYDSSADIGHIEVPYVLTRASADDAVGTRLQIADLRSAARSLDLKQVRTGSIGLVSPLQSLIAATRAGTAVPADRGFRLLLGESEDDAEDIAERVLAAFELRAVLKVKKRRAQLKVFSRDGSKPYIELSEGVSGRCGDFAADIRFFPRQRGAFRGLGIDGRRVYTWVRDNSGVAVFDREFRVSPYGDPGDDWLRLTTDAASNSRHPRSSLALKHFPMSDAEQVSTAENWMLRLPESAQLIGVILVAGARSSDREGSGPEGLVAAADREGFIANEAFEELFDLVRGAVEAIAAADRRRQREREERERREQLSRLRAEAAAAAKEVEGNKRLAASEKKRLLTAITQMAATADAHELATRERVRQLEVMSLLGVVAGFMTHEFGVAMHELDGAQEVLERAAKRVPALKEDAERLATARERLAEFLDYSTAYIRGARIAPSKAYPVLPRLRHVRATFEQYAAERGVTVEQEIARDLPAPLVPTAFYDGVLLNLFTNALKATTGLASQDADRRISFRGWNDRGWHHLEVADTGAGIPSALRERIFDPLFTTTQSNEDPLGSGMGLGLALVRTSVETFGGTVRVTDPPPGFSTCVVVRLPLHPPEDT